MTPGGLTRSSQRATLAVHPGALGDVLLAVPALRALRAGAGGPLVVAAQPRIGALLEALEVVDGHVGFEALGLDALVVDDPARAPPPLPRGRGAGRRSDGSSAGSALATRCSCAGSPRWCRALSWPPRSATTH